MPDVTIESHDLIRGFIADALAKDYPTDPDLDPETSRLVSVYASLVRKSGYVLQHAVETALHAAEHTRVWQEPKFQISHEAHGLASKTAIATCLRTDLPYAVNTRHQLSRDLIVVNERSRVGGSYDVKRGNSSPDSGKKRQLIEDTLATQMLLRDYLRREGYQVDTVEARIISIYNRTGLPAPITIPGTELNRHFDADVEARVRESAETFRMELAQLMPLLGFRPA